MCVVDNRDNIGSGDNKDFMVRYLGDRYVDIIGYDDFSIGDLKNEKVKTATIRCIQLVTYEAEKRGKDVDCLKLATD